MVIGRHPGQLHGVGRILVARITIDYHEEVHYPASFTVGVGVSRIGTSSFTDSLAIFGGDTWLGACDTVHVFAGPDGPAPVPDWLRAEFETCPVRSALREV
jgi:acyl-CoA thioester hydrolase